MKKKLNENMQKNNSERSLEVYHLYHSGVAVSIDDSLLIFDYYNDQSIGNERSLSTGVISKNELQAYDRIYVFASHGHSDHYNPIIFDWLKYNKNIHYILSSDIDLSNNELNKVENKVDFLDKDYTFKLNNIEIKSYGSTDLGISFLLKIDNNTIFHAGDLNWWHWKSFSKDELQKEEEDYKREVNKLKGKDIDIAFVPVDPRLEEYFHLAGAYFINKIKPALFVPIHFSSNFDISKKFAEKFSDSDSKIAVISQRGEKLIYNS